MTRPVVCCGACCGLFGGLPGGSWGRGGFLGVSCCFWRHVGGLGGNLVGEGSRCFFEFPLSSCLRQVPPPCQPSTLGGDCSNHGDGDDDDDDQEEEEEDEEEGCHMWRVSFLPW